MTTTMILSSLVNVTRIRVFQHWFCAALVLATLLISFSQVRADVKIERIDPVIQRRTFDPNHPPSEMPKLHKDEAAVTQSAFGVESRIGGEVLPAVGSSRRATVKIDSVSMTLRLKIVIWLPEGAVPKIVNHEEGHKTIAEYFYKDAERIARAQAEKLIGTSVAGSGDDVNKASDEALGKAAVKLGAAYLGQVDTPCGKAQERYDALTEHGTNAVKEKKAIEQSIREAQDSS